VKNPVSAGIGKFGITNGLEQSLSLLRDAGIEYLDFWLCHYCEQLDTPMRLDGWKEWVKDTKVLFDSYGIKVGQNHAHWRLKSQINEDFSYKDPWTVIYRNFEACRMFGTGELIFHPIERWMSVDSEDTLNRVIEANAGFFSKLVEEAEKWDIHIDVENLFDHKHLCAPNYPAFPFSRPEHLLKLADLIGSDRIGFCLDSGHANIAGNDIPSMIRALGSRLYALHLNDNYGLIGPIYEDVHLFPGYGRIDWKPVFEALDEIGYKGTLNMEVIGEFHRVPYAAAVAQLRAAREQLEIFRDTYTK